MNYSSTQPIRLISIEAGYRVGDFWIDYYKTKRSEFVINCAPVDLIHRLGLNSLIRIQSDIHYIDEIVEITKIDKSSLLEVVLEGITK